MNDNSQLLLAAAQRLLKPLVKMLLRYGIGYPAFADMAKTVFYDVAKAEFVLPGKKQTASRISTMTGLSRKEAARLEALPPERNVLDQSRINRAARVISGWVRDTDFHSAKNTPADLAFEGDEQSFTALVKSYSGDITARTIADELTRVGAISVTPSGLLHLNQRAYVPNTDEADKLALLGSDVADLISTFDHNISAREQPRLQRKVAYNYIPPEHLEEINEKLTKIAQRNLEAMDQLLSQYAVPKRSAKKHVRFHRTGVGIYLFTGEQQ